MDKLREKLKKGFNLNGSSGSSSLFSSKPTAFAGTGRKLGTVEVKAPPPLSPADPASDSSILGRPPVTAAPVASGPSTSLHQPPPPLPSSLAATVCPPPDQPPLIDFTPQADESILSAIDQLSTDPHCAASAQILSRLIKNIIANPSEEKYRKIRLGNPKIQSAIVDTHGGVELILACGFVIVFETNEDAQNEIENESESLNNPRAVEAGPIEEHDGERKTQVEEGFAILHTDADLEPLQAAVALLQQKWPASLTSQPTVPPTLSVPETETPVGPAAPPIKDREWAAPCDRKTQVILPASVDTDVPSWFFERTGQDLKASFLAAVRKREQSQILMTKALREKIAKNGGSLQAPGSQQVPISTTATVKVRLPEGISLQGEFSAGEPVAVVFAWVADCLCDPLQTFDLVLPDRRVLEFNTKAESNGGGSRSGGTAAKAGSAAAIYSKRAAERPSSIKEAGLMPSVTVNLRWTGPSAVEMKGVPALRRELYTQAAA
ncbi:hypothetical protein Ndes2437B_g07756 [Nannochloris sp. 'desiccata']